MNYQWYPGHMTKAKRMMQENIKLIDLIIEVVDARIPFSSRNPDIDELGKNKARLILLNKSDLADERENEKWAEYFKSKGYYVVKLPREFKNRWTVPGDEKHTNIPAIISKRQYEDNKDLMYAYNAYNYSTERIAKGDFIRMKEISLSYDFPKSWITSAKISNLSLKLQATNLFLIYADKKLNGQDPEFFNTGGVASPVPRQFTLTLRLGF